MLHPCWSLHRDHYVYHCKSLYRGTGRVQKASRNIAHNQSPATGFKLSKFCPRPMSIGSQLRHWLLRCIHVWRCRFRLVGESRPNVAVVRPLQLCQLLLLGSVFEQKPDGGQDGQTGYSRTGANARFSSSGKVAATCIVAVLGITAVRRSRIVARGGQRRRGLRGGRGCC